jgi:hypothetical protein
MKIISTDGGGNRFVVQTGEDSGYIVDLGQAYKSGEMTMMQIFKGGYWEGYNGRLTPEELDRRIEINRKDLKRRGLR